MDWYYPHSVPHGLFLKIEKDPVPQISPQQVGADRAFWDAYAAKLLANPKFLNDRPARMSFAKLRNSIANIYAFRQMWPEAEYAYRQALQLAPNNSEVVFRLCEVLTRLERFDEGIAIARDFEKMDKFNPQVGGLIRSVEDRRQFTAARRTLAEKAAAGTATVQERFQLVDLCVRLNLWDEFEKRVDEVVAMPGLDANTLRNLASFCAQNKRVDAVYRVMKVWARMDAGNAALFYDIAALAATRGNAGEAREALAQAIRVGGDGFRSNAQRDGRFGPFRALPEFVELLGPAPQVPGPAPAQAPPAP